ncbi:DegQ family serine endoprotease [soil metagenome]
MIFQAFERRAMLGASLLLSLLLTPFAAGAQTVAAAPAVPAAPAAAGTPATAIPVQPPSVRGLPDFTDLVEKAGPGVVNIRTTERARASSNNGMPELDENDPFYEFFRRFLPPNQQPNQPNAPRGNNRRGNTDDDPGVERNRGVGSGFIVTADGYVLTNAHVVRGADEIYVTLTDRREFKGKLIGADTRSDVAVVKIEATNLPRLAIGSVDELKVGQWVVAIGSPFGLENTVTAGIISAKSRETGEYLPFIQTDVAVNPGNSGGPLLNMKGEVIGVNSQILSQTGGFMGVSFAIPVDEAMRVADQLRSNGRVSRGRIGVRIGEVPKDVAEAFGLKGGAAIVSIEAGSPAEKAGMEAGDIALKWQGRGIERATDLQRGVGNTKPGSTGTISIWRRGQTKDLQVTVAELPDEEARAGGAPATPRDAKPPAEPNMLGLVVNDIPASRKSELKIKNGVQVESADGPAARTGVRAGDVLISLNNTDVTSAKQFAELVGKLDRSKAAVLLVRRGESAQYITIRPTRTQPAQ